MKSDIGKSSSHRVGSTVEPEAFMDVSSWLTTRRAGLHETASVTLTRPVWNAIENVPLERIASSDVVQRLHAVLAGAACAIADLPREFRHPPSNLTRIVPYTARLQTRIDGPDESHFVATVSVDYSGKRYLMIGF